MKLLALIGRISFSLVFFATGLNDFGDSTINNAATLGVPLPYLLVPLSGMLSLLGALSILFGFKAKTGAWLILLFVLPLTFITNKFWLVSNPLQMMAQAGYGLNDLLMLSGALLFAYFGAGQLSFDARAKNQISIETEKAGFPYSEILIGPNATINF
jgi:uncharacterized membrane protein YphA (DoxX/SURF4 family)